MNAKYGLETYPEALRQLPVVSQPCEEIRVEAERIVSTKYSLDRLARKGMRSFLAPALVEGRRKSVESVDADLFAYAVIPFLRMRERHEAGRNLGYMNVPTRQVIGENWRWFIEDLENEGEDVLAKSFGAFQDRAVRHVTSVDRNERASYIWISQLGIGIISSNGLNRVGLYRRIGAPFIPALVTEMMYPSPDRIRLYQVHAADTNVIVAVLDDQYAQRLPFPEFTQRLLCAYGVPEISRLPKQYERIAANIVNIQGSRPIDLIEMTKQLSKESNRRSLEMESVIACLEDINSIKPSLRHTLVASIGATVFGALGVEMLRLNWEWEAFTAAILLFATGLLMGVVLYPRLKILRTNRGMTKPSAKQSQS